MNLVRTSFVLLISLATLRVAVAQDATTRPSEPVDFRKLKEALPAELLGIRRTEANGEKNAMGGFKISQARGTYTTDADNAPRIEVTYTDYSGTQGMADAMAAWSKMEIDREGRFVGQKLFRSDSFRSSSPADSSCRCRRPTWRPISSRRSAKS